MFAPLVGLAGLKLFTSVVFPESLLYLVVWTTACWLAVTWFTPPESDETLVAFYTRTRPGGPGWRRVARLAGLPPPIQLRGQLLDWVAGVLMVYGTLLGIGASLLPTGNSARLFLAVAAGSGLWLYWRLAGRGWHTAHD